MRETKGRFPPDLVCDLPKKGHICTALLKEENLGIKRKELEEEDEDPTRRSRRKKNRISYSDFPDIELEK